MRAGCVAAACIRIHTLFRIFEPLSPASDPGPSSVNFFGRCTYPNPQTGDPIFNSTTVDAAWGDFPNTGAGTFTVARLTISNGATGTIQGRFGHTADGTGVTFSAPVPPTGGSTNTASISGTVWKDSDGDGVKDSTETGLSGVTVYLDKNNNSALDSGETTTTTSSTG